MKLHLPQALRKALLAILIPSAVSSVSFAEITPIIYQDHEDTLSFNDGSRPFGFEGTEISSPSFSISFQDNNDIEFKNNIGSKSTSSPRIYGGGVFLASTGASKINFLNNNGDIHFINNVAANHGGAISTYGVNTSLELLFENTAGEIRFESNYTSDLTELSLTISSAHGGAIYSSSEDDSITFKNNDTVIFLNNSAENSYDYAELAPGAKGGAIYSNQGNISFEGNKQVVFQGNSSAGAGAIYSSRLSITDTTEKVLFSGNQATGAVFEDGFYRTGTGGAIYVNATDPIFDISDNASVIFENNTAQGSGGAIALNAGKETKTAEIIFQNNTELTFSGNIAIDGNGGAINSTNQNSTLLFQGNTTILFENNSANSGKVATKSYGGAITFNGDLSIDGNTEVIFKNNSAGNDGGAIYFSSSANTKILSIANNDTVEFRGNYVKHYDEEGTTLTGAVLNSISSSANLELSTKASGGSITFYDTLQAVQTVNLNSYKDSDGNTVTGTGAITLSGKYAEEDLTNIFNTLGLDTTGDGFQDCLTKSLTSTITSGTNVTLHGGSLNVTDGAILNIQKRNDIAKGSYIAKAGSPHRDIQRSHEH